MKPNPAVPVETLKKVQDLLKGGISIEDIVDRLRTETDPTGYPCHPWRSGVYISVYVLYVDTVYVMCMYSVHVCGVYIVCVCVCVCWSMRVYVCTNL